MLLSQNFPAALCQKDTIMRPQRDEASVMQSAEELKVSMAFLKPLEVFPTLIFTFIYPAFPNMCFMGITKFIFKKGTPIK